MPRPAAAAPIDTIQIGMGWFPEQPGGLDRYYFDLVRRLPAAGVRVRGLVTGSAAVGEQSGGAVRAFAATAAGPLHRGRAVRRAVGALVAERRPDLLVCHFALYGLPALVRARRVPLVVHFHGPWAAESAAEGAGRLAARVKRGVEAAVYRRAARVVVLSRAFGDVLCRDYGVDAGRVRVVPGGVDVGRFDTPVSPAEARRRLGWPAGRPILLAVRRLVRRMGLENLIDAVAAVRRSVPDVLLLIAGRGRLAGDLQARAAAAGLADHVRLLGFVPDDDLPLAYRAADLSVVPSVALEGFGLIAAESLAAGTPPIVTPIGGLPEVVGDLAPGLIAASPAPADLAASITSALRGTAGLPDRAECAAFARRRFAWDTVARRVRDVYAEALE